MYNYIELINKDIVLFPKGKFQQDIEDFFEELNVIFYLNNVESSENEISDKRTVHLLDYENKNNDKSLVIICAFNCEEYIKDLASIGLRYEEDYIFGMDLIHMVDETETFYLAQNEPGKKVIVMGTGSLCEFLIANNPGLNIEYFIDNNEALHGQKFHGKEIKSIDELKKETTGEFIIIVASSYIVEIKKQLSDIGLSFGDDFYFYEKECYFVQHRRIMLPYFNSIDELDHTKKVIVFGTDSLSEHLLRTYPKLKVDYFIDNNINKHGLFFHNKEIKSPDVLKNEPPGRFIVIIASSSVIELEIQLLTYNLLPKRDFLFYPNSSLRSFIIKKSDLLAKTIIDAPRFNLSCNYTTKALIIANYPCYACCAFAGVPMQDIRYNSLKNVFKTTYSRIARLSFINRTYSFCRGCENTLCQNNILNYDYKMIRNNVPIPKISDVHISFNYDQSCNLICKSCRKERIASPDESNVQTIQLIHEEVVRMMPQIKIFHIGSGEVFFSKYYKELLFDKFSSDEVFILTNGILFNKQNWDKLKVKYKDIRISFSIDAATKKTYEYLRGGDFDILYKNLQMAAELRARNEIKLFSISMVVQKDNFREMIDFVSFGSSLGVDKVIFRKVANWGTWTDNEYTEIDVFNPNNKFYNEFYEILNNSILKQNCIDKDF